MSMRSERIYDQLLSEMPRKKNNPTEDVLGGLMQQYHKARLMADVQTQAQEVMRDMQQWSNSKQFKKLLEKADENHLDVAALIPLPLQKKIYQLDRLYEEMGYEDVNTLATVETELAERIRKQKKREEEARRLAKKKAPLYQTYAYSEEEMMELYAKFQVEVKAFGKMPQSAEEAKEISGWMLPFLFSYDSLFTGRWDYWRDLIAKGTLEGSGPIPQIEWSNDTSSIHQVSKMLQDCLNLVVPYGSTISEFADWLLWGLGMAEEPAKIPDDVHEHWYKTFDLALVLKYPADYLSGLLEEATSMGQKQHLGYFSTPLSVTEAMSQMVFSDVDPEQQKYQEVYDGCVGCGAMFLPASNYSLFASGQDINPVAIKLCKVQMMWYAPWFVKNPFSKETLQLTDEAKERLETWEKEQLN